MNEKGITLTQQGLFHLCVSLYTGDKHKDVKLQLILSEKYKKNRCISMKKKKPKYMYY